MVTGFIQNIETMRESREHFNSIIPSLSDHSTDCDHHGQVRSHHLRYRRPSSSFLGLVILDFH